MQQNQYKKDWQILSTLHRGLKSLPEIQHDNSEQQYSQAILSTIYRYNRIMQKKIAQMNISLQHLNLKISQLYENQKKIIQIFVLKTNKERNKQQQRYYSQENKKIKPQSELKKLIEKSFISPKKKQSQMKINNNSTSVGKNKLSAMNQSATSFKNNEQCDTQQSHLHKHILFLQNQLKNLKKIQQPNIAKKLQYTTNQSNQNNSALSKLALENKFLKDKLNQKTIYLKEISFQIKKVKSHISELSQPCQFCGLKARLLSQLQSY